MSIEGLERFTVKLGRLEDVDIRIPTSKAIALVQEAAKSSVRVRSSELRGSIYIDVRGNELDAHSTCFTNKSYAGYVEFGTGPNGQANHQGISPNIPVAYRQTGWMMPASAMSEEEARGYGFGIAKDKDGKVIGYYTKGQPARPFLYPAMADNVEEIIDIYKKYVKEKTGEV